MTSASPPADRGGATISAVIVAYNSSSCVGRCITSIREALETAEIVVVDNASQDETVSVVRAADPDAQVIEVGENIGFGRACNVAAQAAGGSHVLFLNPDAVVAGIDADQLGALLDTRPFGLVAPTLQGEGERLRAESSLIAGYFLHTFNALLPTRWRPSRRVGDAQSAWVSAAMLLVSRDEFLRVGGFDPRFFLYYEDRDLSRRYRDSGLPIRTTNAILGRHAGGRSSQDDGLRARPAAWSFLGWIQFVAIHHDQRTADRAARAALVTLRVLRVAMNAVAATRWARAQRKARQLDEILLAVAEYALRNDARYCPDAVRVVRGLI